MNPETINSLGEYLNGQIGMETCDSSLSRSAEWLRERGFEDIEKEIDWLRDQGANCDCEVVTVLYLNLKEEGPNLIASSGM